MGFVVSRPIDDPLQQLAIAGLSIDTQNVKGSVNEWFIQHVHCSRLVLILDQFEEIFTSCSKEIRKEFIQLLQILLEIPSVTVIVIMRDDFYKQFMDESVLRMWTEQSGGELYIPANITYQDLTAIIQKPASQLGLQFEDGLIDILIRDAIEARKVYEGNDADSTVLPLLEFTLEELWRRRSNNTLKRSAYTAIGGVTGGLTQWADDVFYGIEAKYQNEARRILIELVHVGEEDQQSPDTRRRVSLDVLYSKTYTKEKTHQIVMQLATGKLLVTTYDKKHNHEMLEIIHDVLLREWVLLKQSLDMHRNFLVWYQEQERRAQAWIKTNIEKKDKRSKYLLLRKKELKEANTWIKASKIDVGQNVQELIEASKQLQRRVLLRYATFGFLATGVSTGSLAFWLIDTVIPRYTTVFPAYTGHTGAIYCVSFSPDESRLASGSNDRTAQVSSVNTGDNIKTFSDHKRTVTSLSWSSETGYLVASSGADGKVRIWVADTQIEKTFVYSGHYDAVLTVAWSPNGKYIASGAGNADRTIQIWHADERVIWGAWAEGKVWDKRIGTRLVTYTQHEGPVNCVAWSPDGKYIASGSGDATVHVWNPTSGKQIYVYRGHIVSGHVKTVAWSPNGNYIASGGFDKSVHVWSAMNGTLFSQYSGHKGAQVTGLAWSPDGKYLATASTDKTVHIWEVSKGDVAPYCIFEEHKVAVNCVAWSRNNSYIASGGDDKVARIWQLK